MRALVWVVFVAGCVQSSSIQCSDGLVCPDGTRCAPVPSHSLEVCAVQPDLDACTGMADGTACETSGSCIDGVCLHHCGDGIRTGAEECDGSDLGGKTSCKQLGYYDDAPLVCSPACTYDVVGDYSGGCTGKCGDGTVNGPELCEDSLGWQDARTCVDFGLDYGDMTCAQCGPSFADCKEIGLKPKLFASGALHGRARDDVWLVSGDHAQHFDGASWTTTVLPGGGFEAIWVDGSGNAWAAGMAGDATGGQGSGEIAYWNGTTWTNVPVSGSGGLNGIWASGAGDAWAVGGVGPVTSQTGTIVHAIGGTAEAISIPTLPTLRAIWGSAANDVWAVGDSGTIVHYDGNAWQPVSSPAGSSLTAIYGSSADDIWAVGGGNLFHKGSVGWAPVTGPAAVGGFSTVWTDGIRVWVGGYSAVFEYVDGLWWALPPSGQVGAHGIWGSSATDVWFAVQQSAGTLSHYGGAAWMHSHVEDSATTARVWFDGTTVWAATAASGNVNVYKYNGTSWSLVPEVSGAQAQVSISGTSATDVWVLRQFQPTGQFGDPWGEIDHFDGSTWTTKLTVPFPTMPPSAIWANSETDAWAVGAGFWHWDGTSWTETSTTQSARMVWGSSASDVWAADSNGQILHYNGSTWSESLPVGSAAINSLWGSGPNDVWAVGSEILHYNGSAWTTTHLPVPNYALVTGSSATDVFVVTYSGTLYHWDGIAWTPVRTDYAASTPPAAMWGGGNRLFLGLYTTGDIVDLLREPGW